MGRLGIEGTAHPWQKHWPVWGRCGDTGIFCRPSCGNKRSREKRGLFPACACCLYGAGFAPPIPVCVSPQPLYQKRLLFNRVISKICFQEAPRIAKKPPFWAVGGKGEVGIISRFGKPFYQDNGLHTAGPVLKQQRPAKQEKGIKMPFGLPAEGIQVTPLQVQGQSVGAVAVHPALLRAATRNRLPSMAIQPWLSSMARACCTGRMETWNLSARSQMGGRDSPWDTTPHWIIIRRYS